MIKKSQKEMQMSPEEFYEQLEEKINIFIPYQCESKNNYFCYKILTFKYLYYMPEGNQNLDGKEKLI